MVDASSVVEVAFSDTAIARWEKTQGATVTARQHKAIVLKSLMRVCGLSSSKLSVLELRIILKSLKKTKLPTSQDEVQRVLKDTYKIPTSGVCINHVFPPTHDHDYIICRSRNAFISTTCAQVVASYGSRFECGTWSSNFGDRRLQLEAQHVTAT